MPSGTKRSQVGRPSTRAKINAKLLAAIESLLAQGETYTEMTIEDLMAEAGLSRSTFYVYYEDKVALVKALAEDVIADIIALGQGWWDLDPDATDEDLRKAIAAMMDAYQPHGALIAMLKEAAFYDAAVKEQYSSFTQRASRAIAGHIRAGQKAGSVRTALDPARTATWLTWLLERGFYELVRGATPAERRRHLDAVTAVVWNTLYTGAR